MISSTTKKERRGGVREAMRKDEREGERKKTDKKRKKKEKKRKEKVILPQGKDSLLKQIFPVKHED